MPESSRREVTGEGVGSEKVNFVYDYIALFYDANPAGYVLILDTCYLLLRALARLFLRERQFAMLAFQASHWAL